MSGAREHMDDEQLERVQLRVRKLEQVIANLPFMVGHLVEDEAIATTATAVQHRLGKTPRGFIVVSVTPDAAIGLSATQPTDMTRSVNLEASAACTADVWFW